MGLMFETHAVVLYAICFSHDGEQLMNFDLITDLDDQSIVTHTGEGKARKSPMTQLTVGSEKYIFSNWLARGSHKLLAVAS